MLAWIDNGCDKLCHNWWQSRGPDQGHPNSVLFRATQQPTDLEVNHTQRLSFSLLQIKLNKTSARTGEVAQS